MLESAPALLVLSGGRPLSVLTRTDVLAYFGAIAAAKLADRANERPARAIGRGR